ncbi:cell division cycle 20-like protein 1, cofactor of APC complex [Nematocida sp. AWRm77]|nr:cell division cycle 20-like protein 1, cofactor of APC complex [Nematocida sp. AWRm77]
MRRFTFLAEQPTLSEDDLLEKCPGTKQEAFAQEYRKIFSSLKNSCLQIAPPAETKPHAEKPPGPIRTTRVKGLADDFYSSLLDWQGSSIVFALDERVFVQNFLTGRTSLLSRLNSTYITSVKLSPGGDSVGVGTCTGDVAIIDMEGKVVARKHQHKSRIGVIRWSGKQMLTGSRDRSVKYLDLRTGDSTQSVTVHTQEVCGISFSPCGEYLATGGNDNKVCILNGRAPSAVLHNITAHRAAVKAIDWCPERTDMLATGGGTADRTVKVWKLSGSTPFLTESKDYGSQICNLRWTRKNELITTHGYSQNDIRISKMGGHRQTRVFEGHKNRVIHFGMSTDEEYFATGSGDETLCVWRARENDLGNFLMR